MSNWSHKHILTLSNFSIEDYKSVFELTERFKSLSNSGTKKIPALQGNLITSIFFSQYTNNYGTAFRQKWMTLPFIIFFLISNQKVYYFYNKRKL